MFTYLFVSLLFNVGVLGYNRRSKGGILSLHDETQKWFGGLEKWHHSLH